MDRATLVIALLVPAVALGAVARAGQAPQQAAAPSPSQAAANPSAGGTAASAAVAALLERAERSEPGTYSISGTTLSPSTDALPLTIQADALRGQQNTVHVVVALGSEVTQPAVTRARIVAAARSGVARRVVSEISGTSRAGLVRSVGDATLAPGEYELQAVVAQSGSAGPVLAAFTRARLLVPDLWQGGLAASPLVLGDAVSAAPTATSGSAFAFGPTALLPATSNRFSQRRPLHVAFRIFNWTAPPQDKPDLQVEYLFYEQTPQRGIFFNKVKAQLLNAQTLGDRFDPASGAVNAGMTIPLAAFPPGEFRLLVRVTDNRSKQTAAQDTRFFVVP
jgi:hypothetical protein